MEAKTVWSVRTRAAMVRLGRAGMLMRRARKANQVVATGPKMAGGEGRVVLVGWWRGGEGGREGGEGRSRRGGCMYHRHIKPFVLSG